MRTALLLVMAITLFLAPFARSGGQPTVASMPPVVVKTIPASGDTQVDAGLKEIRVTFSKEMKTREMWSFVKVSDDTFPKTGKPHYLKDKRTIVLPVTLQKGKTYATWINSQKHNAFRDTGNRPAVPYLLVFETKN